ncbi:hypothetical protein OF83DRAFT_1122139, partial [Amylostereum chailletii]
MRQRWPLLRQFQLLLPAPALSRLVLYPAVASASQNRLAWATPTAVRQWTRHPLCRLQRGRRRRQVSDQ